MHRHVRVGGVADTQRRRRLPFDEHRVEHLGADPRRSIRLVQVAVLELVLPHQELAIRPPFSGALLHAPRRGEPPQQQRHLVGGRVGVGRRVVPEQVVAPVRQLRRNPLGHANLVQVFQAVIPVERPDAVAEARDDSVEIAAVAAERDQFAMQVLGAGRLHRPQLVVADFEIRFGERTRCTGRNVAASALSPRHVPQIACGLLLRQVPGVGEHEGADAARRVADCLLAFRRRLAPRRDHRGKAQRGPENPATNRFGPRRRRPLAHAQGRHRGRARPSGLLELTLPPAFVRPETASRRLHATLPANARPWLRRRGQLASSCCSSPLRTSMIS